MTSQYQQQQRFPVLQIYADVQIECEVVLSRCGGWDFTVKELLIPKDISKHKLEYPFCCTFLKFPSVILIFFPFSQLFHIVDLDLTVQKIISVSLGFKISQFMKSQNDFATSFALLISEV
jgi:hypothetical protein